MKAFLLTAFRPTTPRSFPITTRHGVRFQGGKKPDGTVTRARGTSKGVKINPAARKAG